MLGRRLPDRDDAHADMDSFRFYFSNQMENAHARRSAIDFDHRRNLGRFQPTHIPAHITEGKRIYYSGVFEIDPVIGRAKAALAKHARRDHDPLTLVTRAGNQSPFFEFRQITPYGLPRIPRIAKLRVCAVRKVLPDLRSIASSGVPGKTQVRLRLHVSPFERFDPLEQLDTPDHSNRSNRSIRSSRFIAAP